MEALSSLAAGRPIRTRSNWCPICRRRFKDGEYEIHVEKEHVFSMPKAEEKNSMRKDKPSSDFKESQMIKAMKSEKVSLNLSHVIKKQKMAKENHYITLLKKRSLNQKTLVICPKCGIQRAGEKSLKAHLFVAHTHFYKSAHTLQTKTTLKTLTELHVKSIQGKFLIRTIPLLVCPECGTQRWGKQRLNRHIMIMHRNFLEEQYVKSVERKNLMQQQTLPFKCPLCGVYCWGEHRLKTHIVIAHREFLLRSPCTVQFKVVEQLDNSVKREILVQKSPLLTCPECGIQRLGEQTLKSHIVIAHKKSLGKSLGTLLSKVTLEKSTEQCVKSVTRKFLIQETPPLKCPQCGVVRWGEQRLKTHIILVHRKLLRKSLGILQTNAEESLTKQSVKSLKKKNLMQKTSLVMCPQCGIHRLGEKRLKTHKVIAHRELLRKCSATIPKNPQIMCSECLVIRNGDQKLKTHVFMAHRDLLKKSSESTEYHESYRDFKVIVYKDYITFAQNLFIQGKIFHSIVAILGLEAAISFCRKHFSDMFDCNPELAEATRKLILLAGIKGDINNSIQNLIRDLFKKNSESAGISTKNLSAISNAKPTILSQNPLGELFKENPQSARTSDKNLLGNDKEICFHFDRNSLRRSCNKNPESAGTSDKNLLVNDKEKATNFSQNPLGEIIYENQESPGTSNKTLSTNNNEETTNFSQNPLRGLFNENPESAETHTSDKNLFVNDKEKSCNSSQNPLEELYNKNPKLAGATTAQLPECPNLPIVNQPYLQTVYYLPPGSGNARLIEILPKFDIKSVEYCKWLRAFIRKTKKLKYPLPLYKCQNIRQILDDITPAIATYPTEFIDGRPHHYYFMRLHKILSRMLTKQLKYVLSANEE